MIRFFYSMLLYSILFFTALPLSAAPTIEKIWEMGGLDNPESVVYDSKKMHLYVSNVNGEPLSKDGNGYISIVSLTGEIVNKKWVLGLNAPKGLALSDNILYVSDIDRLLAIQTDSGEIIAEYKDKNAGFLNDVTIGEDGAIYTSDMTKNRIYRLIQGDFQVWLDSPDLKWPNGLYAKSNYLIVGSWGEITNTNTKGGPLQQIVISNKTITPMTLEIGNLDGVESDGHGNFYVTDWVNGQLLWVKENQKEVLLTLSKGLADHEYIIEKSLLILPMMLDNTLLAYRVTNNE